ncbi:MAG: PIG-L deacetylase family protein [Bdellovibrionales bacterium]
MPLQHLMNATKDIIVSLLVKATQLLMSLHARDASPWLNHAPILIIAPHPDDETLGCGGFILRARQQGSEIRIVIVSDGAQGSKGNNIAASQLAVIRQQEALCATSQLGLKPHQVTFLNFPDGKLSSCAKALDEKLSEQIARLSPHIVMSPYLKENHPDHRAIAESIARLRQKGNLKGLWVEYPVWFWPAGAWNFLLNPNASQLYKLEISGISAQKQAAMASYRSQLQIAKRKQTTTRCFRPRTLAANFLGKNEYYILPHTKRQNQALTIGHPIVDKSPPHL